MAVEHKEVTLSATRSEKESEKKMAALKSTADHRLQRLKYSKAEIDELKDYCEMTKDELAEKLTSAESEIGLLREQLLCADEDKEQLEMKLKELTYHEVKKVGNPKTWDHVVTQLVVEMLAHCTPPSCVAPNILSVAKLCAPNATIIHELPSDRFIRYCRSVLLYLTKTLAAFEIARAKMYQQLFTDGTGRRQTEMQNVVIGILTDGGY